ncbi:DNA primase [Pseudomonas coronafaciens pv. porri]|uniref:DNA primase n=1 Tax=Pseudomonas coronafaciens pv. porri TaxID=83964 RepID=A0ABR5JTF5_9PSED|nr:LPD7 domain-containing protein [Pseudomonas coronafaciens]KOP60798.1 DNA primase [Pseudomonas coronafaciens pv. porri]
MTLTIDHAKKLVIEFCATYPVASTISYKIRETQEELYGPQATREAAGTILGSFHPRGRRAVFATANFSKDEEFTRSLRHEILGHFGINTFNPSEKRAVLNALIDARTEPSTAALWTKVDQLYPGISDLRKAEEVFAFACEEIDPDAHANTLEGARSFRETCIDRSRPMQISDLINLTSMVAEGLHDRSRSQQNFPASDNAQFKIETAPRTSEYPVWLAVPPDDRDKARLSAGRLSDGRAAIAWNKEEKLWFARPGCDLDRITDWLPDPSRRAGGGDAESEFLDVLTQAGLVVKGMPVMNGSRQRVATVDDKHGKKSGVYCGFLDRRPAGWFINYHRADSPKDVTNWAATGGESDPITRLHIRAGAKQAQEDAARDRAVTYAKQTLAAKRLYDRLPAADPAHPYLVRKGIPPTPDIRQTRNGALVVPFFNASGTFKTLQYIPPEGEKFLFKDAPKQEHFLVVGGSLDPVNPILYAEGYATARSLNLATGLPVVMTIDAGNMVAVAKVLHQQYPDSRHLFMADFDHAKDVNKGLIMANEAAIAVGGQVLYPTFNDAEIARGFTDFNDLHQSRGLDAVREQTAPLIRPYEEVTTMPTDSNTQPPDNTAQKVATPAQETLELDAAPAASIQVPDQSAPPQTRSAQPVASEASSVESQSPETAQVTEAPVGIDDAQVSTQPPLALSPAEQLASVEADPDASAIVDEQPKATMSVATDRNTPSDAPALNQPPLAAAEPEQSNETAQPAARSAQQQAPGEAAPGSSANVDDQKRAAPPAATDQEMSSDAPVLNRPPLAAAEPEQSNETAQPAAPPAKQQASVEPDPDTSPVAEDQPIIAPAGPAQNEDNESLSDVEVPVSGALPRRFTTARKTGPAVVPDAIFVGAPIGADEPQLQASNIDKDALLARISREVQGDNSVLYKLDAEPAFVDRGSRLEMVQGAGQEDEKVIAALLTAAQFYRGRIELTGSDEFKAKAIELIAQHQINVEMKNPAQQMLLDDARNALKQPPVTLDAIHGDTPPPYGGPQPSQAKPSAPQPQQAAPASTAYQPLEVEGLQRPLVQPALPAQPDAPVINPPSAAPASDQPATSANQQVSPAIHQPFQAAKDGVTGKILKFGQKPFRFEPDKPESTFITLRTKNGVQTFWGKELAGLLRQTRVQPGKMVTLQWLGNFPVTVKVPRKNDQGVTVGYDDKDVHRNQWALKVEGNPAVRSGQDEGVKLGAYDAGRFAVVQQAWLAQLGVEAPLPTPPTDGLYWLTPNGEGSAKTGDELSAPRPPIDPNNTAGQPVISSWSQDGHLDMYLVRGDGPYLQGVVRQGDQMQHVLVSLPGRNDGPSMVFNAITPEGLLPIGTGNGINRSGGEPVSREHIAFKLEGDSAVRIGKLDAPGEVPPTLHNLLGFDQRWKEENTLPKSAPTAAPSVQPSDPRPV